MINIVSGGKVVNTDMRQWLKQNLAKNSSLGIAAAIQIPYSLECLSCCTGGANIQRTAISQSPSDLAIIAFVAFRWAQSPMSLSAKSSPNSFCSCAHYAGHKMSRTEARQAFTIGDLKQQTAGVQCKKDNSVLDEIPGAYKDIDQVMLNQSDLVEVVHTIKG